MAQIKLSTVRKLWALGPVAGIRHTNVLAVLLDRCDKVRMAARYVSFLNGGIDAEPFSRQAVEAVAQKYNGSLTPESSARLTYSSVVWEVYRVLLAKRAA